MECVKEISTKGCLCETCQIERLQENEYALKTSLDWHKTELNQKQDQIRAFSKDTKRLWIENKGLKAQLTEVKNLCEEEREEYQEHLWEQEEHGEIDFITAELYEMVALKIIVKLERILEGKQNETSKTDVTE